MSVLNRVDEAVEMFDKAEAILGENKEKNIKYAKLIFIRGLSSKRISTDTAIHVLTESLVAFESILKTDKQFYSCSALFEMGVILKMEENYPDAHDLFTQAGKNISVYGKHEVYGDFSGENHPLMQQYFLNEFEWADSMILEDIKQQMMDKYIKLAYSCNECSDKSKKSIFTLEASFQKLSDVYYSSSIKCNSYELAKQVKEMEMLMMDHGMYESVQLINWAKCFLAVTLAQENSMQKGLSLLDDLIDEYVITLDGEEVHPFL